MLTAQVSYIDQTNMEYPKLKKSPTVTFHPPKMKSTKKVHFSMNHHHSHHKKAESKSSKLYPKHSHSCIIHCLSSAELSDGFHLNEAVSRSNKYPSFKQFKDPITNQKKFILHRNHHAYTVTDGSSDDGTDDVPTDPPSDKPIPPMDPTLQSTKRITCSTSSMLKSTMIVDPSKPNEAESIVSEKMK
jgi:hypothetical protein